MTNTHTTDAIPSIRLWADTICVQLEKVDPSAKGHTLTILRSSAEPSISANVDGETSAVHQFIFDELKSCKY